MSRQSIPFMKTISGELLAVMLILCIGLVVFVQCLSIGYISDDYDLLAAATSSNYSVFDVFPAGRGTYFRPLVMLSLRLEHGLGAIDPAFTHHLANLAMHILNGVLVYAICRSLIGAGIGPLALALLFLVHPANVTNAYWISGRTDLLVTLFYLLSIFSFIRFLSVRRTVWLVACGAGLVAGLLSKESAITLTGELLILLLLFYHWGQPRFQLAGHSRRWGVALFFCLISLSAAYLIYVYVRFYNSRYEIDVKGMLEALAVFPILLVFPNHQSLLIRVYRYFPASLWIGLVGVLVLGIISGVLLARRFSKRELWLGFGLLCLVMVTAVPAIVFGGGLSSRNMYLSIALLCVSLAVWTLAKPIVKRYLYWIVWPLIVLAAAASAWQGAAWVHNWRLTQTYCESLRAILAEASVDSPILFLTMPGILQDVPLFSNDLNGAAFYCLNGEFGYFSNLTWLGDLYVDGSALKSGDVSLVQEPSGVFSVAVLPNDAYFISPGGSSTGEVYSLSYGSLRINALRADGWVTGFSLELSDNWLQSGYYVLFFDGGQFQQLMPVR